MSPPESPPAREWPLQTSSLLPHPPPGPSGVGGPAGVLGLSPTSKPHSRDQATLCQVENSTSGLRAGGEVLGTVTRTEDRGAGSRRQRPRRPLTCRLLLTRCAPHLLTRRSHLEKQSKKLQSLSPVQFCSRISLILGSKKAMSTSIATTCSQTAPGIKGRWAQPRGRPRGAPCPPASRGPGGAGSQSSAASGRAQAVLEDVT